MTLDSVYPIFFCKHFNVGLSVVYRYQIMLTTFPYIGRLCRYRNMLKTFLFKHEPLQMSYTGIKTLKTPFRM